MPIYIYKAYHLMETLQMGLIPIHVHEEDSGNIPSSEEDDNDDDNRNENNNNHDKINTTKSRHRRHSFSCGNRMGEEAWLPYEFRLTNESISYATSLSCFDDLIQHLLLRNINSNNSINSKSSTYSIEETEKKILSLKKELFSFDGVMKQIEKFLKTSTQQVVKVGPPLNDNQQIVNNDNHDDNNDCFADGDTLDKKAVHSINNKTCIENGDLKLTAQQQQQQYMQKRVMSSNSDLVCRKLPDFPHNNQAPPPMVDYMGNLVSVRVRDFCEYMVKDPSHLW
jgi:hypothetical protein